MIDENLKTIIDDYTESEYIRGKQNAQIQMLLDICNMKARKIGEHDHQYGYTLDDAKVECSTILAIFHEKYPQSILDLFKKPEKEETKEGAEDAGSKE